MHYNKIRYMLYTWILNSSFKARGYGAFNLIPAEFFLENEEPMPIFKHITDFKLKYLSFKMRYQQSEKTFAELK